MVKNCISRSPEASALFYDELAGVVEKVPLDPRIMVCVAGTRHYISSVVCMFLCFSH